MEPWESSLRKWIEEDTTSHFYEYASDVSAAIAELERLRGENELLKAPDGGKGVLAWQRCYERMLRDKDGRIAALDKVRDAADLINTSVSFDSCDACGSCTTCALFGNLDEALAALEDRQEDG